MPSRHARSQVWTVCANAVEFVTMARGAGYRTATAVDDLGDLRRRLPEKNRDAELLRVGLRGR